MSDNSDTITALARLEEAERENQKLRSERLLAEHARDEAQREVGRVRDMLAIAERDRDIYRTNSYDWEADCGDWRKRAEAAESELAAPINEDALRRRNGGALPVGNGCEIAVRGTTARAEAAEARAVQAESELFGMSTVLQMTKEQLATAEARARELEEQRENWRMSSVCRELEARLRAVTEAGDAMQDALLDRAHFVDPIAVNVATRWDTARNGGAK